MKNRKEGKIKISNILLLVLIIVAIGLIVVIGIKYNERNKNEQNLVEVISYVNDNIQEDTQTEIPYIQYEGYQVIGIVEIPKINIEYPILIESTKDALEKSIARFGNGKVNEVGNLCLAGHNYINGTMFGKIDKLENGDEISILDLHGNKVIYTVFDKYVTDPNDNKVTESINNQSKEVTLITCINGNKDRLIVKAKEK